MKREGFFSLFENEKPVIGMLHLKGDNKEDIFERFKRELATYVECKVDGIVIETYFGTYSSLEQALKYAEESGIAIPYGVNCLNVDTMGFVLAERYHAKFLQLDSVVGHVKPRDEETLQAYFDYMRPQYAGYVLGGVRFKYQPLLSDRTLAEDLAIAKTRCDGICVTQDRTGQETSIEKIKEFKEDIGQFPLIVAAGVTPKNIYESFAYADAAIVGSYFKDTYTDDGEICADHIKELMDAVRDIRGKDHND